MYEQGFRTEWNDFHIYKNEGYYTSMADFHTHEYYEINLILSGNFKILFKNRSEESKSYKLVLTRPGTPHYISCKPDTLFSRLYLLFSDEFLCDYVPEWRRLLTIFGESGKAITLTEEQKDTCQALILRIREETQSFRQKLLILYLLSYIADLDVEENHHYQKCPSYIHDTLLYVAEHYNEKIVAANLAEKLHISRTTLMTNFKKHTGHTLNDYIVNYRLNRSIQMLREGCTLQETAESCGFGESSSLARSFRQTYGMSTRQYLLKNAD